MVAQTHPLQPIHPLEPEQHGGHEGHQNHQGPTVVLFVFVGLLIGGVLREINKKTKIPYTPMLLVTGVFMGYCRHSLGIVGQSTDIIEKLNPHMILLIFIPVLIFESGKNLCYLAFNCDWHVFRKSLVNILILAGPGVLWGAILIAITFKVILAYPDQQLTWYQSLTLGCVLSATDPVAVVALLKQLGASVRFNTLVEGQSLMNDGTAMVFFLLFLDLSKGNSSSMTGVVVNFVRVAFGGPLLGIAIGIIVSFWMKKIIRDPVLSVNITFVGAYVCFYLAEFTELKVSGILSIVSLGLYMSAVGKRKIYPESEHALHNVWGYIQYACQTLIFILTGIVVGVQMIQQSTITIWDWVRMFLFWFLMIGLRSLMVLTFYPLLKGIGYGLTKKQLVVLIYGGLRGALGLCLALIVGVDQELPVRFRQITVFYMCGMAILTIVVNGLTCGKVVDYVQMIHVPQIKKKLFKRCIKQVLDSTQVKMKQLKQDPDYAYAKWKDVEQLAAVRMLGTTEHERRNTQASQPEIRDSLNDIKKTQMLEEIRFRFTRYINKVYWQLYEQGQVSQEGIKVLSESCDIVNDTPQNRLNYFQVLSTTFTMQTVKYYMKFKDWSLIGSFVTRMLISKLYYVYEVSIVFIEACEQAQHAFTNDFPLNTEYLHHVLEEVKQNVDNAIAYITEIQNNYPQIIQAVHTSRASSTLLKHKKNKLKHMFEEGFVDDTEYQQLRKQIDRGLVNVNFNQFKLEDIHFNDVLTDCPLFASLSAQQVINLKMKANERVFQKGSKIISKDKQIKNVYILMSGTVKQQFDDFYFIRGIGNVLNAYDFTYGETSKCSVKASSVTKVMELKPEIINDLIKNRPGFKKAWYKNIFMYSVRHNKSLQFLENNFSEKEMRRFVEASSIKLMRAGDLQAIEFGAYVFEGQVTIDGNNYGKEHFVSQNTSIKATNDVILMKFNKVAGIGFKQDERISVFNIKDRN